ncbi:transposase [Alteromonas sp. ASW11-130]|uniref:transposase n=1 Tax=Alteromonas sp. ASW11-130 TaxID=3015775 RepID=UPI002241F6EE|nr:transposase [Alteromonas sp. ASW11-130]MCW8093440.1 transposase [Alteromonas sp. ASW11-130]
MELTAEYYPEALWQRCTVHTYRTVFSAVARTKTSCVLNILKAKAIHGTETLVVARKKLTQVGDEQRSM